MDKRVTQEKAPKQKAISHVILESSLFPLYSPYYRKIF